jgi:hypothetical protein
MVRMRTEDGLHRCILSGRYAKKEARGDAI